MTNAEKVAILELYNYWRESMARTASARDAYDVAILAEESAYKAVGEARINFRR